MTPSAPTCCRASRSAAWASRWRWRQRSSTWPRPRPRWSRGRPCSSTGAGRRAEKTPMVRRSALARVAAVFAVLVPLAVAAPDAKRAAVLQARAVRLVERAGEAASRSGADFTTLATEAADQLDALAPELAPAVELQREVKSMALE